MSTNVRNRNLLIVGLIAAIVVAVGSTTAVRGPRATIAVTSSITAGTSITSQGGVTTSHSTTTTSKPPKR